MSDIFEPQSAETAAAIIRAAGTPLAIRGGGTRPLVPAQGPALSTRAFSGITLYEPSEMVIGAKAGTPLAEIEATLAEKGQMLTFEPMDHRPLLGTSGAPTIGAVAALNISGPRRPSAGAARDSLIGITFINGAGDILRSGGRVMKNVTGLDLVKLQAGAAGALGLLTEVIFKVGPKPAFSLTLEWAGLESARAVAGAMKTALNSPCEVSGAAHLSSTLTGGETRTLLRLEGFLDQVRERADILSGLLSGYGPVLRHEAAASEALWREIRDAAPLAGAGEVVWRIGTKPLAGPAVRKVIAEERFGHWLHDWGGGLSWFATSAEGDGGAALVRAAAGAVGGHARLERAPPALRALVPTFHPEAEAVARLARGVKASIDPRGVFASALGA